LPKKSTSVGLEPGYAGCCGRAGGGYEGAEYDGPDGAEEDAALLAWMALRMRSSDVCMPIIWDCMTWSGVGRSRMCVKERIVKEKNVSRCRHDGLDRQTYEILAFET